MFEKRTDPHAPQTFSPNGSLPRKEQFFTTFLKSDFAFPLEMTNSKMCQSFCPPKICFIIAAGTSLSSSVSFRNRRARSGRAGGVTCRCRRAGRGRCRRPNPAAGTRVRVRRTPCARPRAGTAHGLGLFLAFQARVQKQGVQRGVSGKTEAEGHCPERRDTDGPPRGRT